MDTPGHQTSTQRLDAQSRLRLSAGIVGPLLYVITWVVAGMAIEGYSPARDAISELGALGARTAPAMSAGFVLFGLAALPFAAEVDRRLPGRGGGVRAAMVVCGLATVGAAALPCSAGCPGPGSTLTDTGHSVVATVGYLALMGAPLLVAGRLRGRAGWSGVARWSLAAGVLGSLGLLAWALGLAGPDWGGGLQRAFNTLADVWWAGLGVVLLRRGADGPGGTE